jgi:hypothetical protein
MIFVGRRDRRGFGEVERRAAGRLRDESRPAVICFDSAGQASGLAYHLGPHLRTFAVPALAHPFAVHGIPVTLWVCTDRRQGGPSSITARTASS